MTDSPESSAVRDALPLRPTVYAMLVTLAAEPSHGYAVMQRVNEQMGRRALLGPGTLYRTLKELRDLDWIEPSEPPESAETEDERRRYYRLTPLGRQVTEAETGRLERLVRAARRGRAPRPGSARA